MSRSCVKYTDNIFFLGFFDENDDSYTVNTVIFKSRMALMKVNNFIQLLSNTKGFAFVSIVGTSYITLAVCPELRPIFIY